jgi:hypothetical protein
MKKFIFFNVLLILTSVGLKAQQTSNLVVFSDDASLFYVIVNGIKQNIEPRSNVKITGLTNPANQVTVIFSEEKKGSLKKSMYFPEMGVEASTKLTKTKKGYKMRYFGEVPINTVQSDSNQWSTIYHTSEPSSDFSGTTNTNTNTVSTNTNPIQNNVGITTTSNTNTNNTNINNTSTVVTNNDSNGNGTVTTTNSEITNTQISNTGSNTQVTNTNTQNYSSAVDLNYIWSQGSVYQFSAIQIDDISTSVMGMNMKDQFTTATDFALYITGVTSNGQATGILYLLNFKVTDSRNTVLASMNDIPKSAIQSDVTVDRKGKFTFLNKIMLITTEKGNVLAYGKTDGTSIQMGGQAGNMQVDAYAEFDPKTGKLNAGYNVKEIKTTKKVSVTVDENTDMIDVLPYDYLELLLLPDGAIAQGDKSIMNAGMYSVNCTATSVYNGIAVLNYQMSTDKTKDPISGGASGSDASGNSMFNMDMMGGMEGMELDEEDKEGMNMMTAMSPTMTCDINSSFNYASGMFDHISGTVNTSMDTMGMKLEVKSRLQMKKL